MGQYIVSQSNPFQWCPNDNRPFPLVLVHRSVSKKYRIRYYKSLSWIVTFCCLTGISNGKSVPSSKRTRQAMEFLFCLYLLLFLPEKSDAPSRLSSRGLCFLLEKNFNMVGDCEALNKCPRKTNWRSFIYVSFLTTRQSDVFPNLLLKFIQWMGFCPKKKKKLWSNFSTLNFRWLIKRQAIINRPFLFSMGNFIPLNDYTCIYNLCSQMKKVNVYEKWNCFLSFHLNMLQ